MSEFRVDYGNTKITLHNEVAHYTEEEEKHFLGQEFALKVHYLFRTSFKERFKANQECSF